MLFKMIIPSAGEDVVYSLHLMYLISRGIEVDTVFSFLI